MKINKKSLKKAAEEIVAKMAIEEKRLLKTMTAKKVEKILKSVRKYRVMVDEDVMYQKVGITYEEFNDFCNYLNKRYLPDFTSNSKYDCSNEFPDYRASFQYKRTKFLLRLLIGQGSSWGLWNLYSIEEAEYRKWPSKKHPMAYDEDNKIIIKMEK